METLYNQWKFILMPIKAKIIKITRDATHRLEYNKLLHRFMVRMVNMEPTGIIYKNLRTDEYPYNTLIQEIKDKHFMNDRCAKAFAAFIQQKILSLIPDTEPIEPIITDTVITYRDFKTTYIPDMPISIIIKYELLFPTGTSINVSPEWYSNMSTKFTNIVEGFASPLQRGFKPAEFCSIFNDDGLGNLFNINPDTLRYKMLVNIPPHIPKIITRLIKFQQMLLDSAPLEIVMCVNDEYEVPATYIKYSEVVETTHMYVFSSHRKTSSAASNNYKTIASGW